VPLSSPWPNKDLVRGFFLPMSSGSGFYAEFLYFFYFIKKFI